MDNTSYMENLNLSDISKEDQKHNVNSAISSEETRTKVDDHNSESDHHILGIDENTILTSKNLFDDSSY